MGKQKFHFHSMIIHAVIALIPLAAVAYLLFRLELRVLSFDQATWRFITCGAIIVTFLISFPAMLSGVFERGHGYAKWHSTHKVKLILSFLLTACLAGELYIFYRDGLEGERSLILGILILLGNTIITILLNAYGLKITLGRQSLAKTSYHPDLSGKEPVDILVAAGIHRKEGAKFLDLLTER
jgi:uncharacterized membrane protein